MGDDDPKNILLEFLSLIDIMKRYHKVRKCTVSKNDLSLVLEFDTLLQCEKVINDQGMNSLRVMVERVYDGMFLHLTTRGNSVRVTLGLKNQ